MKILVTKDFVSCEGHEEELLEGLERLIRTYIKEDVIKSEEMLNQVVKNALKKPETEDETIPEDKKKEIVSLLSDIFSVDSAKVEQLFDILG